ncbi:MAG: hypothetical protein ACYDA9_18050 [Terriglobia bacterium]
MSSIWVIVFLVNLKRQLCLTAYFILTALTVTVPGKLDSSSGEFAWNGL